MPNKQRLTKENIESNSEAMDHRKSLTDDSTSMPQITQPQMRRASKWDTQLLRVPQERRFSIFSRTSISGASQTTKPLPPVKYENTFKIGPDNGFEAAKARGLIAQTLKEYLTGVEYPPNARKLTTLITEEIKKRVKSLGYARYKYVVTLTICPAARQSMQIVSRCLWNKDTDNFAEVTFKTANIYAVATLYACYFE